MILLLDVGNTRLKWGWLQDREIRATGALLHRGRAAADWLAGMPADAKPARVLAANVAGPAVAHALGEWALERHGLRVTFALAGRSLGGVTNAYRQPEALGVDRWLGMVGAWQRVRGPLLCIAAGTALTVDAVGADGRHLGGWILPGHALMSESLRQGTAGIARAEALAEPAYEGAFGTNSAGAGEGGGWQALAAAAERAIGLLRDTNGVEPAVFIGGGDAGQVAERLGRPATVGADLVMEGLAVLARGD